MRRRQHTLYLKQKMFIWRSQKSEKHKYTVLNLKTFVHQKYFYENESASVQVGKDICCALSDKVLFRIHKEFLQVKKKTENPIGKWTNDRHFKKEDSLMRLGTFRMAEWLLSIRQVIASAERLWRKRNPHLQLVGT